MVAASASIATQGQPNAKGAMELLASTRVWSAYRGPRENGRSIGHNRHRSDVECGGRATLAHSFVLNWPQSYGVKQSASTPRDERGRLRPAQSTARSCRVRYIARAWRGWTLSVSHFFSSPY